MTSTSLRGVLSALALVLLATPALAQAPAPDAAPRHGADHQRMHEMMEQHRQMMAQDLHTILHIRPDQEAAFAAFQSSTARPPHEDHMKGDMAAMAAMTTPQKLDMMQAKMDERMAHMRAHIQATKAFYAVLSPEQQRVFDALMRMHGGHGGGHWGHGGGHMHGGEGGPPPPLPGQ